MNQIPLSQTLVLILSLAMACVSITRLEAQTSTTWQLDNFSVIGGEQVVTVRGDPSLIDTPFGKGMLFDGDDGIIIDDNPIAGAAAFTMEMIFRPDPIANPSSNAPRVFHVEVTDQDHRVIEEIRVDGNEWYLDAFLKSGRSADPGQDDSLALIDPAIRYRLGEWYNYAIVYDGTELRAYLDGELQISGEITVIPLSAGQTSLGMRHDVRAFFEGVISRVRFTDAALDPSNFLKIPHPPLRIIEIKRLANGATVELSWNSSPARTYTIERSSDLKTWSKIETDVVGMEDTTTYSDTRITAGTSLLYYRVRLND